jgi:hypothetical protein
MKLFSRRKPLIWIGLTIGVLGLGLLATKAASNIQAQRLRGKLGQVQQMIDKGRLAAAREKPVDLARKWPSDGQVLLLLGNCEEMLERPDRALAAWKRVPVSNTNFVRAAESRGSLLINRGHFAAAGSLLLDSRRKAPENSRHPLLRALARLLRLERRYVDVSEVLSMHARIATETRSSGPLRPSTRRCMIRSIELFGKKVRQIASRLLICPHRIAIPMKLAAKAVVIGPRCHGDRAQDLRLERLAELLCQARHLRGVADRLVSFVKLQKARLEALDLVLLALEFVSVVCLGLFLSDCNQAVERMEIRRIDRDKTFQRSPLRIDVAAMRSQPSRYPLDLNRRCVVDRQVPHRLA